MIRLLTLEDAPEAIDLRYTIEELRKTYDKKGKSVHIQCMQEEMAQAAKHVTGDDTHEKLVTAAESSAENSQIAMIAGVAMKDAWRGRGYASAVVFLNGEKSFYAHFMIIRPQNGSIIASVFGK